MVEYQERMHSDAHLLQWIDRETGIAGGLFTQLMPLGDASVAGLLTELEMALYRAVDREAHSSSDAKL